MAEVFFGSELRPAAGGARSLEIAAASVRELLAELDRRFPGLAARVAEMAVAIDGEVIPDALFEPLEPESEVHFLPPVRGG